MSLTINRDSFEMLRKFLDAVEAEDEALQAIESQMEALRKGVSSLRNEKRNLRAQLRRALDSAGAGARVMTKGH